ncbi:MAG: zinc ribbon domain-containing protein [Actinomycetia bacterium]|nr:zinc ribbon domain-containing protein [Actinomycetes bacterium]
MPTYEYHCNQCGANLEVFQQFTDAPLTVCPTCQGKLRKVFSPVGIVFKGSGFYSTDSQHKGKKKAAKDAVAVSAPTVTAKETHAEPAPAPAEKPASPPPAAPAAD